MASEESDKLIVFGKKRNPELEEIRDSVPGPPSIEDDVEELLQATRIVHAGFLFTADGFPALKQICRFVLCVSECWREFAANLGIDPVEVECMQQYHDMTYVCENVLKAFAQKDHPSLDLVVSSLHKMKRVDAIHHCKSPLLDLVGAVLKNHERSHIITAEDGQSGLITPSCLPEVSITFKNLSKLRQQTSSSQLRRENNELQEECCEHDTINTDASQLQNETQKYTYLVMLTFASDGAEVAKRIANVFRQTYSSDGSRVGVVILQEHFSRISERGSKFVLGFINDVDYVVPIVTKGYVKTVLEDDDTLVDVQTSCLDHKYARYVYEQMQAEYLNMHCVNAKVRPVIPDNYVKQARHEFIMADALFQSWCAESKVAEMAKRLL